MEGSYGKSMNEADRAARIQTLILALQDPHVSVGWNAARELAKMGGEASSALPALSAVLRARDATTALWARYAIARITGDIAKHLPVFIKALSDRHVWPGMAATAISGFGAEAQEAVPFLIPQLTSSRGDDRWSAAWALGSIGAEAREATPALIAALEDADEKVRWYAAWALGSIGPDAGAAVPALIEALNDMDDDVRGYAALALGKIGTVSQSAIPALNFLLEDENRQIVEAAQTALAALSASV
jgi:HEAT repeat protein